MILEVREIKINGSMITDFKSFHQEFKSKLGFFEGYGNNMDAWIDCMRDIHDDTKMSQLLLPNDTGLILNISDAEQLESPVPQLSMSTLRATRRRLYIYFLAKVIFCRISHHEYPSRNK
jgi:hypothetical protein